MGVRPRRVAGACLALLTLVTGATACSGPTSQDDAVPSRYVEKPTVSAGAQSRYDAGAGRAYDEITRFSMDQWLKDDLLDPSDTAAVTPVTLSQGIVPALAPNTVPHWQRLVTSAIGGDAAAREDVALLRFHDWQAPTLTAPARSPIKSQSVTQGKIDVGKAYADGTVPLVVTFRQQARITLLRSNAPYPATLTKDLTLQLVPRTSPAATASAPASTSSAPATSTASATTGSSNSAAWLISSFEGSLEVEFDDAGPQEPSESGTGELSATPATVATPAASGAVATAS